MIHQLPKKNILSTLVNLFPSGSLAIASGNQMKCQKLVWQAYDAVKEHIINKATLGMQLNQPIFKISVLQVYSN